MRIVHIIILIRTGKSSVGGNKFTHQEEWVWFYVKTIIIINMYMYDVYLHENKFVLARSAWNEMRVLLIKFNSREKRYNWIYAIRRGNVLVLLVFFRLVILSVGQLVMDGAERWMRIAMESHKLISRVRRNRWNRIWCGLAWRSAFFFCSTKSTTFFH